MNMFWVAVALSTRYRLNFKDNLAIIFDDF